jgi:hypothetical protein
VRGIDAEHADLSGRARTEAFQDLDRGRLPGPVRPEQDEHLTPAGTEVDPVEHVDRPVPHPQAANVDGRALPVASRARLIQVHVPHLPSGLCVER